MSPGSVSAELREQILKDAGNRCGYCRSSQRLIYGQLQIEHIHPKARGGASDMENLWAACSLCNGFKETQTHGRDPLTGRRVRLFNPRFQKWFRHFRWSENGTEIIGRTAAGRVTITALRLNHLLAVEVRRAWVSAGWHPP